MAAVVAQIALPVEAAATPPYPEVTLLFFHAMMVMETLGLLIFCGSRENSNIPVSLI